MLPTFLLIGAMKAGTTALYTMLDAHPEVYMSPVKEPNYFAFAGRDLNFQAPIDQRPDGINNTSITDRSEYEALFAEADPESARGEASHTSLYWPDAAQNIHRLIPDVRLVAILRDPVERAYSEYMHFRRDGDEPIDDFQAALDVESDRIEANWALGRYVDRGRYDEQLERYHERFSSEQIRIFLFDDLVEDAEALAADLFGHIEVDSSVDPQLRRRVNKSGVPKNPWMHSLLTGLQPVREALRPVLPEVLVDWANALKNRNLDKPEMSPEARQRLVHTFEPHVRRLEDMIQRDLSHWLSA